MEEFDKENGSKRSKDRSPSPAVKSTAVVKYTAVPCPAGYSQLQCNTDLNLPPSNWGAAIDSYGLKQILTRGSGLSSFRMAHMFPDSVGQVDVISGAECIKKLLKLPYQPKGTISMIVHRVENTLLLDDFDVYDYLTKSEWSWLKDFFYENVLKTMSEQERMTLMIEDKTSTALQTALTSKFLFHSVASLPEPEECKQQATSPMCLEGPFLPEPEEQQNEPESPPTEHLYNRNVSWTFEDIHMLIGSDLPIFGGNNRPCVSLRLRDAREPINVLTGIDYWLDNLMCNVPEVLMCYHLDGIVQKYEPMKTEDLPTMENSKFSPKVIRNVAQNILSFLKSNATKAGHTYWLFKGPGDDVVKLYDLTSLCPDSLDNPFTTPVAMLLYRVARNMRLTNRSKHVKQLLEHAIELLKVERYPQIVASSHYMLADLYVPATTNPACPDFKEETSSDSDNEDVYAEEQENVSLVKTRGLALRDIGDRVRSNDTGHKAKLDNNAGSLGTSPPDRCGKALQHALKGLLALHNVTIDKCKEEERQRLKQQILIEEQHPNMANPYEPIKMNYEPIRKRETKTESKEHQSRSRKKKREKKYLIEKAKDNVDKNAILIRKDSNMLPTFQEPDRNDNFAWKLHLKTLLYEKICLSYATLAEYSYANEQYGFSLKYIDMASKCQKLLSNMIIKSRVVDAGCLLGRVGDNFFQLSKNWARIEQFKKQFFTDHDVDSKLKLEIENDLVEEVEGECEKEFDLNTNLPDSEVYAMELSCEFYKKAIEVTDDTKMQELLRRLASVKNELGARFMNDAQLNYIKYTEETEDGDTDKGKVILKQFINQSKKSWECLQEATDIFMKVMDVPNLALLYCNQGRYMRFKAHCDINGTCDRRALYSKAEDLYETALKLLGSKDTCPSIWELVSWEMSCHLYTKASLMQDQPTNNDVNEVADALKHALKYCQQNIGPRQYLYQFRAAMIYQRLGSLYHSQYRITQEEGPKRRSLLNATRMNYELSANIFASLEDSGMFLTVIMSHVALLETQATVSQNVKLKSLQTALQLLKQCQSIMKVIKERDEDEPKVDNNEKEGKSDEKSDNTTKKVEKTDETDEKGARDEKSLLNLFENRLHCILKNIIQYCRSKTNKDYEKMTEMYKKLYCAALKIKKNDNLKLYASSMCDVLNSIDEIMKTYEA